VRDDRQSLGSRLAFVDRFCWLALRRQWKWLVADGVIGVLAGILAIAYPSITVLALGLLLGIGLLIQGVVEVMAGFAAVAGTAGRVTMVVWGSIVLSAGLICLVQPGAGVFAIAVGLAIWFALVGATDLWLAFAGSEHRAYNAALGVLSILAAIILLADGNAAIATIAVLAGLAFLLRGLLALYLGWRLRSLPG
jgi:uncharacterized membrane protein HdeD (DUF308 family)